MRRILTTATLCVATLLCSFGAIASEQADALMKQARDYLYSNPKQASYYASQAIELHNGTASPNDDKAEAMITYSQAEQLLGNFDMSIKTLYDAENLINPHNRRLMARLYSLKGRVYSKLGDYSKAIELNDRATSMFKSMGDSSAVAGCYNERGVMLLNMHEYVIAEHFFVRALAINRRLRNLKEIAANLNNMCLYDGDTDEKLDMIREAIAINKNLDSQWSLGENYNNMGKQYYYSGNYDKALEALSTAYDYARNIEARELLCDNYEYRSMVYAAIGDYANAYDYLGKMSELSRELQNNNKLRNIEQEISHKLYDDQRRASEMQQQAYQIQLLNRNMWILATVIILVVVSGILFYKWYKHRKNIQLMEAQYRLQQSERELSELKLVQQQLELENVQNTLNDSRQELTGLAAFLRSRNEMLDKIREMVKEGYKMDSTAIGPHLKKINAYISQYRNSDKTNSNILTSIEDKNKDFLKRLEAKHPKLTPGEKNLAVLIRGNVSTKEIAMLVGALPRTINMNRYRLRKSLGLSAEDDLYNYLQSI